MYYLDQRYWFYFLTYSLFFSPRRQKKKTTIGKRIVIISKKIITKKRYLIKQCHRSKISCAIDARADASDRYGRRRFAGTYIDFTRIIQQYIRCDNHRIWLWRNSTRQRRQHRRLPRHHRARTSSRLRRPSQPSPPLPTATATTLTMDLPLRIETFIFW